MNNSHKNGRKPKLHLSLWEVKKKEEKKTANCRRVSVLPVLSKILERHVFQHLYEHLQKNKLLLDTQFGLRKLQSCQTALLTLTEQIYKAIHKGEYVGLVQLDLSKAFDLVNHSLLLQKLKLYKCDSHTLAWFHSYLSNRVQKVSINNALSNAQVISSGVPQGSILGPLLFLLYVNDLAFCVKNSDVLLYADDTTLSTSGKVIQNIEQKHHQDVKNVLVWCRKNDMVMNIPKSKAMIISTKSKLAELTVPLNVEIDNKAMPCVSSTKLLGVHLDTALSWEKLIEHIKNKVSRNSYLLKKIKAFLPLTARKMFVNSYFLPHLDYCCIVWGNCSNELLNELEK